MPIPEFGNLTKIDLREIWDKEATDFTPWLAKNLNALGDALNMDLQLLAREAPVGSFALDILATDVSRNKNVVIENQLDPTDHEHLGKLLTYAAGYDAGAIIWIANEIREEHRQTIDWLNQHTEEGLDFYAVIIETLKIDNSKPVFVFKPVAFPNEWRKSRINVPESSENSERVEAYKSFFQPLIDELRDKYHFTNARIAQRQSWYSFPSSVNGIVYATSFARGNRVRAEMYIDLGDVDQNKFIFDALVQNKNDLEKSLGEVLQWERLDHRRASRISFYRQGNIEDDSHTLEEIRKWSIDHLLRLKKVIDQILPQIMEDYEKNAAV